MSDENTIPIQVDASGADGIERIVSSIDRLFSALTKLGESGGSSLSRLEGEMQHLSAQMTTGFTELAILTQQGEDKIRAERVKGNDKITQEQLAWEAKQHANSNKFNDKQIEIEVAAENARASTLQGLIEKRDLQTAESNARILAQAERTADRLLTVELASENARARELQGWIEKRDVWVAESNARAVAQAESVADKLLTADIAAENARARELQGLIEKRDVWTAEAAAKSVATEEARLEKLRLLDTAYYTSSLAAQIAAAEKAAVYSALGGNAGAKFGAAASGADVGVLRAEQEAARAAALALAALTTEEARFAAGARAATLATEEQVLSTRTLEGAFKGAAHEAGMYGLAHGQLVALLAGAGLAAALHHIAVTGAEVEYSLASLTALSSSAVPVDINKFIDISAGTVTSLKDAAEGVHALAKAGLDQQQAFAALPDMMRLSALGEMGVAEASMLAVESMHAFGLESEDLGRITDVLVKASASANVSVEKLAEGMKSAATMGRAFGMSLEQTTALVATLEKRGLNIQPLATALASLYEPTAKVTGVMQQFGLSTRDALGGLKDPLVFLDELHDKLTGLKVPVDLLAQLVPKRSIMTVQAATSDIHELRHSIEELNDASGFAFQALISKTDTVEGSFKRLASTTEGSFVKAFEQASPVMRQVEQALMDIAGSEGTVDLLSRLAVTVAGVSKVFVEHLGLIEAAAAAYLGLRVISSVTTWLAGLTTAQLAAAAAATLEAEAEAAQIVMLSTLTPAVLADALAQAELAAASEAAAVGMTAASTGAKLLSTSLGWITAALTLAVVAYEVFHSRLTDDEKQRATHINSVNNTISAYDKEIDRLKELNKQLLLTGENSKHAAGMVALSENRTSKLTDTSELELIQSRLASYRKAPLTSPMDSGAYLDLMAREKTLKSEIIKLDKEADVLRGQDSSLSQITATNKALEEKSKLTEKIHGLTALAGLDSDKGGTAGSRALAPDIAAFQARTVTEANYVEMKAKELDLEQKIKATLGSVPAKADTKGANDQLNAAIALNAQARELLMLKQKTQLLELGFQNKAGNLGDLSYSKAKADLAHEAVNATIEQARANIGLVEGEKNKLSAVQKYNNVVAKGIEENKQIDLRAIDERDNIVRKMADEESKYDAKTQADKGEHLAAFLAEYESTYSTTIDKANADLLDKNNAAYAQDLENRLSFRAKMKEAGSDKAMAQDLEASFSSAFTKMQEGIAALTQKGAGTGLSSIFSNAMAAEKLYSASIDQIMAKQRALQALASKPGAAPALQTAATAELAKINAEAAKVRAVWVDVGKSIATSLTDAFGKGGTALGGLLTASIDYANKKKQIDADLSAAGDDPDKRAAAEIKAADDTASARVNAYGEMASAAKGYFDKNSVGYQVMSGLEKALHIFQMATLAEKLVTSLFVSTASATGVVAGQAVETGAVIAGQTAQNAAKVPGVFMSFLSALGPWGMAAAAVAVAAVLGGAFSGGGGGSVDTSKDRQAAAGTGTVLGDPTAKSASIANSLTILEKNSGLGLVHTESAANSLKELVKGISSLAGVLVGTGVTGGMGATDSIGSAQKTIGSVLGLNHSIGEKLSGGMVGKLIGDIFGGGTEVQDYGISVGSTTVGKARSSGQVQGSQYSDTKTEGGWFSSDSYDTATQSLGDAANKQFAGVIDSLAKTVEQSAKALGIGGDDFNKRLSSFVVDIGKISTKGLTGDQIQKQLEAIFSALGDKMAKLAASDLETFAQVGEGYLQTLSRVANDMIQVRDVFAVLGRTFNATGEKGIALSEGLITAAGDISTLTTNTKYFIDNYLTASERLGPIAASVQAAMDGLHHGNITTVKDFKDLVMMQDLNTSAGQQMYAALTAIAPQFKEVADATYGVTTAAKTMTDILSERKSLQDQLDAQTMSATELLNKQRDALDASNRSLFDQVQAATAAKTAQDAATAAQKAATTSAQTAAQTALQAAYDAQVSTLQTTVTSLGSFSASLRALNKDLALGQMSTLTPEQKYLEARQQFQSTLAAAKSGDTAAQGNYSAAVNAFLSASQTVNASSAQYQSDFASVKTATTAAATWAEAQVSVEQRSLDALNAQLAGQVSIKAAVMTVTQAIQNLALAMGTSIPAPIGSTPGAQYSASMAPAPYVPYQADYTQLSAFDTTSMVAAIKGLQATVEAQTLIISQLGAEQEEQVVAAIGAEGSSIAAAADKIVAATMAAAKAEAQTSNQRQAPV